MKMLTETPVLTANKISKQNTTTVLASDSKQNPTILDNNSTTSAPLDSQNSVSFSLLADAFHCNPNNGSSFLMNTGGNYQKQPTMEQQQPNNNYSQDLYDYNHPLASSANNFILDNLINSDVSGNNPNEKTVNNRQPDSYINLFHLQNINANKFQQQGFASSSAINNKSIVTSKNGKNIKSPSTKNSKIPGPSPISTKQNYSNVKNVWNNSQNPPDSWLPQYTNVSKFGNDNSQPSANNISSGAFGIASANIPMGNQLDPSTILHHSPSQPCTTTNTTRNSKISSPFNLVVGGGSGNLVNGETIFHQQPFHSSLNKSDQISDHAMMFLQAPDISIYSSLVQNDNLLDQNVSSWNRVAASGAWESNQRNQLVPNANNVAASKANNQSGNDSPANLFNVWSGTGGSSGSGNAMMIDPLLGGKMNIQSDLIHSRSSGVSPSGRTSDNVWPLDQWGTGLRASIPATSSAALNDGNLQSSSTSSTPMPMMSMMNQSNQSQQFDFNRNKQAKMLLDFYHENLKYYIEEDLKWTKLLWSFYQGNFHKSSLSEIKHSNHKDIGLEKIILDNLMTNGKVYGSQFSEFTELHDYGHSSQYLDKIMVKNKFHDLKELYTMIFSASNEPGSFIFDSSPNATSSLDQNNVQISMMLEEQLKELEEKTTAMREMDSMGELQIYMLRLLKCYKIMFDMMPKEILMNLSLISDLSDYCDVAHSDPEKATSEDSIEDLSDEAEDSIEATKDLHNSAETKLRESFRRFIQNLRKFNKNAPSIENNLETGKDRNNDINLTSTQKKGKKKKLKSNLDEASEQHKIKVHAQIIAVKMEQSFYLPNYYPISPESLNVSGPIMVFFNRAAKPSKSNIGHITHNWSMVESIEYEISKSYNTHGYHGALVFETRFGDVPGNSDVTDDSNNNVVVPTSLSKLINRLKELFPKISTNQLMEITRQAKYLMMKQNKNQYGFSGIKMGHLVRFIADLIIANGISAPLPSSDNDINEANSKSAGSATEDLRGSSTVSKGITWSKIAAQSNNSTNVDRQCHQSNQSGITQSSTNQNQSISFPATALTISPIMKPTPSSTPLSTTSSSSLSSSPSMMLMMMNNQNNNNSNNNNNNNSSNKLNNMIQINPNSVSMKMANVVSSPSNTTLTTASPLNISSLENNFHSNNCALCKNLVLDCTKKYVSLKNSMTNNASSNPKFSLPHRMPHCRHFFHKECLENITSEQALLSLAEPVRTAMILKTCPLCEKLFELRKDEFPSLK